MVVGQRHILFYHQPHCLRHFTVLISWWIWPRKTSKIGQSCLYSGQLEYNSDGDIVSCNPSATSIDNNFFASESIHWTSPRAFNVGRGWITWSLANALASSAARSCFFWMINRILFKRLLKSSNSINFLYLSWILKAAFTSIESGITWVTTSHCNCCRTGFFLFHLAGFALLVVLSLATIDLMLNNCDKKRCFIALYSSRKACACKGFMLGLMVPSIMSCQRTFRRGSSFHFNDAIFSLLESRPCKRWALTTSLLVSQSITGVFHSFKVLLKSRSQRSAWLCGFDGALSLKCSMDASIPF